MTSAGHLASNPPEQSCKAKENKRPKRGSSEVAIDVGSALTSINAKGEQSLIVKMSTIK